MLFLCIAYAKASGDDRFPINNLHEFIAIHNSYILSIIHTSILLILKVLQKIL